MACFIHMHSFLQYPFANCSIALCCVVLPVMDEKHMVREMNLAVCEDGQPSDKYSYPHFCAIFLKQYLVGTLGYRCIVRLNIRQRNKDIDCVTTIPRHLGNQTMADTPQPCLVKFYTPSMAGNDQGDTESSSFPLQWQKYLEDLLYS